MWPKGKKPSLLTCVLFWFVHSSSALCLPPNFVMEKWSSILPLQSVAPADSDLGEPTRPSTHLAPAGCHRLLCANSLVDRKKSDTGKGKPFQDFKTFMNCLFHIKSCFCCTKFIDVQFYYILPSEKKKVKNKLLCIAATSCVSQP